MTVFKYKPSLGLVFKGGRLEYVAMRNRWIILPSDKANVLQTNHLITGNVTSQMV